MYSVTMVAPKLVRIEGYCKTFEEAQEFARWCEYCDANDGFECPTPHAVWIVMQV